METAEAAQGRGDADLIFKPGYPSGLRPQPTLHEGRELCGIHAIVDSFPGQCPSHKRPTRRELLDTVDSQAYANCFPVGIYPIKTFFTVDALAALFHCWARAHSQGRGYTLVICQPNGSEVHRAPQAGMDEAQQSSLYIYYKAGAGHDGHYCSLVPVDNREAARQAARAERERRDRRRSSAAVRNQNSSIGAWEEDVTEEHAQIPMLKVSPSRR